MVKPDIVITINHNAATLNVERLIVPHASMSGEVILEANEDATAQFPLEYCCMSSDLAIAQLMGSSVRSTALATEALASLVEPLKYIWTIAYKTGRLRIGSPFLVSCPN